MVENQLFKFLSKGVKTNKKKIKQKECKRKEMVAIKIT